MELPINQVADLIEKHRWNFADEFNEIFRNNISSDPGEYNRAHAICLVREAHNEPGDYANNSIKSQLLGVEIQLFFTRDAKDIQTTELQMQKLLTDNGWRITSSRPHAWDPDTGWLTKTIFVERNETIRDGDYQATDYDM